MDSNQQAHDPVVFDVTEADFQTTVLRRSYQVPVVVDFWAEWCAPCRALGPVLERAVRARGGEVVLARLDVDQAPSLAAAFQVQGIPAVKAFIDGALAAEFVGAQPPQVVDQFIDALLPSAADRAAAEAAKLDPEQAAARWQEVIAADPGNIPARVGLAQQALARGDATEALELLKPIDYAPEAVAPLAWARLVAEAANPAARFAGAARQAADGAPEPALDELLAAVREGPGTTRDHARELMLDVFRILGDDDPRTVSYRRALSNALF
jgi:putative thioredoxin